MKTKKKLMVNNSDSEILDLRRKILSGLEISLQRLIKDKRNKNLQLTVSENGKVVHINATDL